MFTFKRCFYHFRGCIQGVPQINKTLTTFTYPPLTSSTSTTLTLTSNSTSNVQDGKPPHSHQVFGVIAGEDCAVFNRKWLIVADGVGGFSKLTQQKMIYATSLSTQIANLLGNSFIHSFYFILYLIIFYDIL